MKPKCITPHCRNKARAKKYCSSCSKKRWRKANPDKAAYQTLKYHATERGIYFDLTFDEFMELAVETEYIQGKGRRSKSKTVHRIVDDGPLPGYTRNNITVIPHGLNSSKKKILSYDYRTKTAVYY